jgi:hypothetical protein
MESILFCYMEIIPPFGAKSKPWKAGRYKNQGLISLRLSIQALPCFQGGAIMLLSERLEVTYAMFSDYRRLRR